MDESSGQDIAEIKAALNILEKRLELLEGHIQGLHRLLAGKSSTSGEHALKHSQVEDSDVSTQQLSAVPVISPAEVTEDMRPPLIMPGSEAITAGRPVISSNGADPQAGDLVNSDTPIAAQIPDSIAQAGELKTPQGKDLSRITLDLDALTGSHQSLEARIGLYWLNRLGVGTLVIGIALLILYSFQYFGPGTKLLTGFLCSASMIGLGEFLERKKGLKWYARGLMGGGWGLAYFSTYSMYFVSSVQVMDNLFLEVVSLLCVAAAATWHAVHRRAEIVATLAIVLGFVTVPLAGVYNLSAYASALLCLASSLLAVKMRWYKLYLWAVVAAYVSYALGIADEIARMQIGALEDLLLRASYLFVYWFVFNAALVRLDEPTPGFRNRLVIATVFNALCFFSGMYSSVEAYLGERQYLFPLSVGLIYGLYCLPARNRNLPAVRKTLLLIGLTLVTASVPMMVTGDWWLTLWLLEVPVLTYLGLSNGIRGMRWFAMGLSFVTGLGLLVDLMNAEHVDMGGVLVPTKAIVAALGVFAYGLSARLHRSVRFHDAQSEFECWAYYHLYFLGSAFTAWLLPPVLLFQNIDGAPIMPESVGQSVLILSWAMECSLVGALGVTIGSRFVRAVSALGGFITCIAILAAKSALWWSVCLSLAILYAGAVWCHRLAERLGVRERRILFYALFTMASFTAWVMTAMRWGDVVLSLRWAGEAAATVGLGLMLRERYVRIIGALGFVTAGWALLFSVGEWNWIAVSGVGLLCYLTGFAYKRPEIGGTVGGERSLADWYCVAGTVVFTLLLGSTLTGSWLSLAWAAQGLLLLIVGFLLPDKWFRVSGLCLFALVMLKLLFVDLSGAETIQRILSFIGAGVALLISSYAYAAFTKKLMASGKKI